MSDRANPAAQTTLAPGTNSKLQAALTDLCRFAVDMLGVDHSGFVSFNKDLSAGFVTAQFPERGFEGLIGSQIPLVGIPMEERLLSDSKGIEISDVGASGAELGIVRGLLQQHSIKSLYIVNVAVGGYVVGSFSLDSVGVTRHFSDEEKDLATSLAKLASMSIENALFLDWQEAFQAATVSLIGEREIERLLQTIVERAKALFSVVEVGVYERRHDRQGEFLQMSASSSEVMVTALRRSDRGMAWQLIDGDAPFLQTPDYSRYQYQASPFRSTSRFGSVLEVPLVWQSERIGVVFINDVVGRTFTDNEAGLLQRFADIATIAIQRCRLLMRVETLSNASSDFSGGLAFGSLSERLQKIAESAAEILEAEMCGVFLMSSGDTLSLEASSGHRPGTFRPGMKFDIKDGERTGLTGAIAKRLLDRHKMSVTSDRRRGRMAINLRGATLTQDPAVRGTEDFSPTGFCHSLLAVPLIAASAGSERFLGILRVSNKRDAGGAPSDRVGFDEENEWVLGILANAAAAAIDAARLVEELSEFSSATHHKTELLSKLTRALEAIRSAQDTPSLLRLIVGQTRQVFAPTVVGLLVQRSPDGPLEVFTGDGKSESLSQLSPLFEVGRGILREFELGVGAVAGSGHAFDLATLAALAPSDRARSSFLVVSGEFGTSRYLLFLSDAGQATSRRAIAIEVLETFARHCTTSLTRLASRERLSRTRRAVDLVATDMVLGDERAALRKVVEGIQLATGCDAVTLHPIGSLDGTGVVLPTTIGLLDQAAADRPYVRIESSAAYRVLHHDGLSDPERDIHVASDSGRDALLGGDFVQREKIASSAAVRLWVRLKSHDPSTGSMEIDRQATKKYVGVLCVNYRQPHVFNPDDLAILELFGHLAAIVLHNQSVYEANLREIRVQRALYSAAASLAEPVDVEATLQRIADEAYKVAAAAGRPVRFVDVMTFGEDLSNARAAYPKEDLAIIKAKLGNSCKKTDGIVGRVWKNKNAIFVNHVKTEPDYICVHEETQSELVAPLIDGQTIIGAINIESANAVGFVDADLTTFSHFATVALEALRIANQLEEIRETKSREENLKDVTWYYVKSGLVLHKHRNDLEQLLDHLTVLRQISLSKGIPQDIAEACEQLVAETDQVKRFAAGVPFDPAEWKVVSIKTLIDKFEEFLRWQPRFREVALTFSTLVPQSISVRVDEVMLMEVLWIFASNSVTAMSSSPSKAFAISTSERPKGTCTLSIMDSGPGIEASIWEKLMKERIDSKKPGKSGIGLRTAALIISQFGGQIRKVRTSASGTQFDLCLPIVDEVES